MHFDLVIPTAAATQQIVSLGIYVASHEGFDQNAFSDPEGDFFQDWYYWTRRAAQVEATGEPRTFSWDADIRTMRKLRGGYKLVYVVSHPLNPQPVELHTSMRLLWFQP